MIGLVAMTLRVVCCAVVSLALFVSSVAAGQSGPPQDPRVAQPERPTVATHAHTVAPGFFELETGLQGSHPVTGVTQIDTPSLLKIGVTSRLQLDLFGGMSALRQPGTTVAGPGDLAVGLKWRLLDRALLLGDFAVQATVKLPTGSREKGTGTGTTDGSLLLISSHEIGTVAIDVNVGYTRRSGDGSAVPRQATIWTVAAGVPLAGRFGWTAEVFGFPGTAGPGGGRPAVGLLTGPTLTIRRDLVLDCGGIVGLTASQGDAVYAGLTWNLGGRQASASKTAASPSSLAK